MVLQNPPRQQEWKNKNIAKKNKPMREEKELLFLDSMSNEMYLGDVPVKTS